MSDANGANRSTVRLAAAPGVPFSPGHDPRRNLGGRVSQEIVAFREAMAESLPKAVKVMSELLEDPDPRVRLAAAAEVMDRGIGKPKAIEIDAEAVVRAELTGIFARLRAALAPEAYKQLLQAMADAEEQ